MKKLVLLILGLVAGNNITAMDPATMMAIGSMLPKEINFSMSFTQYKQKAAQECYRNVNNTIYNEGGTVQIGVGSCTPAQVQQMGSLGKAGDVTYIAFDALNPINLGDLAQPNLTKFQIPQASTNWEHAVAFSFKPTKPQIGVVLNNLGITSKNLNQRSAQVVVRSRRLTQELANNENYADAFRKNNNQLLIEVWARTYPSITGSPEFTQIYNFLVPAEDVGKEVAFSAQPSGLAALTRRLQSRELVTNSFNVFDETTQLSK